MFGQRRSQEFGKKLCRKILLRYLIRLCDVCNQIFHSSYVNPLQLHRELVDGGVGGVGGFGSEGEDEAFEDEEFVGGGAAEFEVGASDEAEGAGEFAAGFVAAGLADEVFGGEGRHAEALPENGPDGAGVAHILLEDDEHLAEGAGEHVEVSDGGIFSAV